MPLTCWRILLKSYLQPLCLLQARSAVARGDFDTAEIKTSSAKTLVNLSIVAGICSYVVLSVILYVYFGIILKNSYGYD